MLLLFESASGYGLFRINNASELTEVSEVQNLLGDCDGSVVSKYFSLEKFQAIRDTAEAVQCATALVESKIAKPLRKILKKVDSSEELCVADAKLGSLIKEKYDIQCVYSPVVHELMRVVREHLSVLAADAVNTAEVQGMTLGLAHSLSRYKLKFSPDKVDTMIVQAINLLDDLDKELNNMMMRLREWYGWHFPELTKIVTDNLAYARTLRSMGLRSNASKTDFSAIIPEEIETALKESAELSMGCEISEEDLATVFSLADRVIELCQYRAKLYEYLKNRMEAIAPNLTMLVGELVGARLIAHAGNLVNLAKHPASTVQVLGAEKALFRALKTKSDTPKYGLIYHASLVGQSSSKNKGKMSRMLAAKCSLAIRYDAFGESEDASIEMGINSRAKLEIRLKALESGKVEKGSFTKKEKRPFHVKTETLEYDPAADSTIKRKVKKEETADDEPSKKKVKTETMNEEGATADPPASPGKKSKKKKAKKEEADEEIEEEPKSPEKTPKKKKKRNSEPETPTAEITAMVEATEIASPKKSKKKRKLEEQEDVASDAEEQEPQENGSAKKKKKKRKSKAAAEE